MVSAKMPASNAIPCGFRGWFGEPYRSSYLYDKLEKNTILVRMRREITDDRILLHSHNSEMCFAIRVSSIQFAFDDKRQLEAHFVLEKFDVNNFDQWKWLQPESKTLRCSLEEDIPWRSKTYDRWYPNALQSQRDRVILKCTDIHDGPSGTLENSRYMTGKLDLMSEPFRECETDLLISNVQKCDDKTPRNSHPVCSRIVNFTEKRKICEYTYDEIDSYLKSKRSSEIEDSASGLLSNQLVKSKKNESFTYTHTVTLTTKVPGVQTSKQK